MKKLMLMAAIVVAAMDAQAGAQFKINCANDNGEKLTVTEYTPPKEPENPYAVVVLTTSEAQLSFAGNITGVHEYNLFDGYGQFVGLKITENKPFAPVCGRCPPELPVKPRPKTYFAKLTVGKSVHDFVCQ